LSISWLRIDKREISIAQLELFAVWLDTEPDVPEGKWFKRFPEMIVCGEGEFVTTFLRFGRLRRARKPSDRKAKNDGSLICSSVVAGPEFAPEGNSILRRICLIELMANGY
jgi:hypothetical protein